MSARTMQSTKTVTRQFDEAGNCVSEVTVIVETDEDIDNTEVPTNEA